jgi:UrcA family protein
MNKRFIRFMSAVPFSAALGVGAMVLGGTAPAMAETQPNIVVQYGDLNMASPEGVQELSYRIQNAAWQVCRDMAPPISGPNGIDNVRCQETLIRQTVDAINNPQLTEIFAATRDDEIWRSG